MARIRTDYKPWLKVEYRGKQIDLPHDVGYVVINRLGEVVGYQSQPRLNGDSWGASGFAYILATNVDATRWWESLTTSGYLMEVAAGVQPRDGKTEYRNYWYAGGPICVPTWAQWVAEDKHGNIVVIEGAMRPNISMYGKWAPKRNQLHVRRDRSGNGWRHSLMNLDHLPTMEQYLPKGFKDELRPITYQRVELMVPSWVNFITSDPNGDIHGHHNRPSVWCNSQWMSNTSSIPMCYLGYTPNHGNWKDTLLFLEQNESEQKVKTNLVPLWEAKYDIELVKSWIGGKSIVELAKKYSLQMDFTEGRLRQLGLLSPYKPNTIEITYHTTIESVLGGRFDGKSGGAYYLPKKEDGVDLAVLVGFARGLSIRAISDGVGVPAYIVLEVFARQFDGMSNFLKRLRFGNWDTLGPVTIAEYKRDANDPVAAEARNLFYRGENLAFEQGYNWVVTDELGDVYAFIEKPIVATPNQPNAFWSCESGGKVLVSRNGARNNWKESREEISGLPTNAPEDYKSVQYMKLRYWVPSWVKFMATNAFGWLYGFAGKPTVGEYRWKFGAKQINIGQSVGMILWEASLYDVENDTYLGHHGLPDQSRAQIKEDLADHPRAKGEPSGYDGEFRTIKTPAHIGVDLADGRDELRTFQFDRAKSMCHGYGPAPAWLNGDDQHRPKFTPAESFTMVTFKLPSKTVATQEAMLTDEMFLAGVAFGMRLNKLLSKQGDSDVKEGN